MAKLFSDTFDVSGEFNPEGPGGQPVDPKDPTASEPNSEFTPEGPGEPTDPGDPVASGPTLDDGFAG